ncbi:MAG: CCDC90 family protein [Magnetococcus sp. MYC-9]
MGTSVLAIPFDTLAFAKDLETAGVPPAQAEAQAKALSGVLQKVEEYRLQELATKGDIKDLKGDIKDLELKIAETKAEIIKWVLGVSSAQIMLIVALIKLLPGGH